MEDKVILVDRQDHAIGVMNKMEAHQLGQLHRAFSIFIFNSKNELLLQQRAFDKYHSAGKWTNTCCSHPKPNETNLAAAQRRLKEEMGMVCELIEGFSFTYKAEFSNQLIEHEFDHVFFGQCDDLPQINPKEVADYKYMSLVDLANELKKKPDDYTAWLRVCFEKVSDYRKSITSN